MTTPATLAFDRLASQYDELVTGEIFQLLRDRTHRTFARRFRTGSRVIEIGCGTGIDTCYLASRGVTVVACDPSEEMLSRSRRRLAHTGCDAKATVLACGLRELASFLDTVAEPHTFDGIISNFGALNCVEDLQPLRGVARRFLRRDGLMLLGLMTRVCALEVLYFTAIRRPALSSRRRGVGPVPVSVAGIDVPTFYHRIDDVRAALGTDFALTAIEGIGVVIPPPYLEPRWRSLPKTIRSAAKRLDSVLAPWPPFNRVGDHVLLQFVMRSPAHA